jgi:hypothetical protein
MTTELEHYASGNDVDWVAIKEAYVCGVVKEDGSLYFPTHVELATQYHSTPSAVAQRSSAGDWGTERDMYVAKVEQRKRERRTEELANQAAEFDRRVLTAARAGISHVEAHFRNAQKLYEDEGIIMRLDSLEKISRTLERYHRVGRLALGESTHEVHSTTHTWIDLLGVALGDSNE